MQTITIWWNDKRIKGKFYLCDFAPILLEILTKQNADKIEVKFPHNSIDIYTKSELLEAVKNG